MGLHSIHAHSPETSKEVIRKPPTCVPLSFNSWWDIILRSKHQFKHRKEQEEEGCHRVLETESQPETTAVNFLTNKDKHLAKHMKRGKYFDLSLKNCSRWWHKICLIFLGPINSKIKPILILHRWRVLTSQQQLFPQNLSTGFWTNKPMNAI